MFSGRTPGDDLSRLLAAGADDFLTKPFSVVQLRARVKAALRLKDAQDRSDLLSRAAAGVQRRAGAGARAPGTASWSTPAAALVLALAKLVEQRSSETGAHLMRLAAVLPGAGRGGGRDPGVRRPARPGVRPSRGGRRPAARHRQGGAPGPRPEQARPAHPGRAGADADAHHDRRRHPGRGVGRGTRSPPGSSTRPSRSPGTTTSGGTGPATRTGWPGRRSRCRPGWWRWPTCTTPCGAGGCTSRRCRTRPPSSRCSSGPPGHFDPALLDVFRQVGRRSSTASTRRPPTDARAPGCFLPPLRR